MLDKIAFEDTLARIVKSVVNCQTHISGLDYTKIQLEYPRFTVKVGSPQYFGGSSINDNYIEVDSKSGLRKIHKQYNLDVEIEAVDEPESSEAYSKLSQLIGVLIADHDILFPDNGLPDVVINSIADISDISVELQTRIENRYRTVITLHGCDTIYEGSIVKVVSADTNVSVL